MIPTRTLTGHWLAVGPWAASAFPTVSDGGAATEEAKDVHAALLALAITPRATIVDARDLPPRRARPALRALRDAAAPEPLVVLRSRSGRPDPDLDRAMEGLDLPFLTAPSAGTPGETTARGAHASEAAAFEDAEFEDAAFEVLPAADRPRDARPASRRPALAPPASGPSPLRASPPPHLAIGTRPATGTRAASAPSPAPASAAHAEFVEGCFVRLGRPEALCRFLLARFAQFTGARRASLMLLDPTRAGLFLKGARGLEPSLVGRARAPLTGGLAGRAVAAARPLFGFASAGGPRGYAGSAYVLLPLGRTAPAEGVVALTDLPGDRLPDPATLRALSRLARRAGSAVATARRLEVAERLSSTDELTQVPNRRAFERALHREIERARRSGTRIAVGLLDVDRFKSLNDRFGHPVGDRVLVQVARRLAGAVRETDLVARWGGEEFAVLLTALHEGTVEEALTALDRARIAVGERPLALGPGLPSPMVTVSGGVALFPTHAEDAAGLVRAADAALYEAKRAGRDRVLHAGPG